MASYGYAMLSFAMLWYGVYTMLWNFLQSYKICMLCYAIDYVVKDKHSATVFLQVTKRTDCGP